MKADGALVAERQLPLGEINCTPSTDVASCLFEPPSAAGDIDPIEVVGDDPVGIAGWEHRHVRGIKENQVARFRDPVVMHVESIRQLREDLDPDRPPDVANGDAVCMGWIDKIGKDATRYMLRLT
jgi:hypothetical protein